MIVWRNTPTREGLVARILHWTMAVFLLGQFLTGWLSETTEDRNASHALMGLGLDERLATLIDACVGAHSTIIAGALPSQDWRDHIDAPALADAILDRIMHTSFRLELTSESMRRLKSSA